MRTYVVQQGDCLASIAQQFGYSGWQVIWNDPGNEDLRTLRKSPNVLFLGDSVVLPDVAKKKVSIQTNQDYEIRVTQAMTRIRVSGAGRRAAARPALPSSSSGRVVNAGRSEKKAGSSKKA